jgi:predicted acylesterase/phospholipase RssA
VLSGGSVYAAYQVGVMKALVRGQSPATAMRRIDPEIYVGTSAGAINAALITSRSSADPVADINYLETVWLNQIGRGQRGGCSPGAIRVRGDILRFFDPQCLRQSPFLPFYYLANDMASFFQFGIERAAEVLSDTTATLGRRFLEFLDLSAVIDVDMFRQILYETIDLERVRQSAKTLLIATTNWRTGMLRMFGNSEMTNEIGYEVVRASSRFPSLAPVYIEGDPYVDGGYVLNTPLSPAIHAGAEELHVIFIDTDIKNIPVRRLENTIDVIDKLYHITSAKMFRLDVERAQHINRGLAILAGRADGFWESNSNLESVSEAAELLQKQSVRPVVPRMLTIHLYRPSLDLGGSLGLMNFDSGHIEALIERGYADALAHDCRSSGCVLPVSAA